jgi:hypothetical protein
MTAQCVLMGLYPNGTSKAAWNDLTNRYGLPTQAQPIPIRTADKFDYILQAVDICPEYDQRLTALFDSAEWKTKTDEMQPWMDWFKTATGFNWANLPEFYNFYDTIMVSKIHNKLGGLQEVKDRFGEIEELANWVEWKKKSIGGKLVAAPLLGSIYFETEKLTIPEASSKRKFVEYSAHDSTLMALAVTAGYDVDPKFQEIASYTSAFLFEMYNDTSKIGTAAYTVNVKFRDGNTGVLSDVAAYTWDQWLVFITNHTYPNTASWCIACNNTGVGGGFPGAGPCYRALVDFNESTWTPDPDWIPPATDAPTPALTAAPTPLPTPEPTVPGDTARPTAPPSNPAPTGSKPTTGVAPTESAGMATQLAETTAQLMEAKASLNSRDTLIVVLAIVLALCALIALVLGLKLRQAKGSNLAGMTPYQAVN